MRYLLAAFFAVSLTAQVAAVRTVGQYDADGTVLYSVFVGTSGQKLESVAVGGTVPVGTRFIEALEMPAGVVFEGVRDNVAVWSLKEIPADRLIGPFTFRAKPDGAGPVVAEPSAAVSFTAPEGGIVEFAGSESPLPLLETSGAHIFDQRGTIDENGKNGPVQIGRTGVVLFVPEGAVRTQTTITVERQLIDNERLPKTAEPLWWCGLYKISISPTEATAKNFAIGFPNRRSVTPGLPLTEATNTDNSWAKDVSLRAFGFGSQFGGSSSCFPQFGMTFCSTGIGGGFGGFNQFGFGVTVADRARATVTGAQLSSSFGTPATPVQTITDGTSNTIVRLIIGR